jgi:signal transduction histidine kinase
MKLTKQIKAELAKAYQCAMEVSILDMKAPLRYINQYISENVSGYGTAADEKVQSREDYRKMVIAGRKQSKDMLFKAKTITPYRPKFVDETTAQFRDEMVVQIGNKKNKHSIHLWFSTLFKYQHGKWQMVMFHGSMPNAASSTEDTFHVREAEKKLKELEQVVAQRTADLQTKTRELEIEASLERVRAVTMGMNKPGDILNICQVFFNELQSLGFKDLRNTLINFWDDENGQLHDYDYSDFAGGNFAKLAYSSHPAFAAFQKKIRKAKDAFAKLVINKQGLKSWRQRRRSSGEYKDPRLNKISALYYYFYSTGVGALGISTFSPISKEEVEVLKKFRNVFDMAYQRYVDIQKAEAQAREAQIELSLERVRAAAMAMRASSEIGNLIFHLYGEITKLDAKLDRCFFMIVNPENLGITWWMAGEEGLLDENGFFVQYNEHLSHLMYLDHWKKRSKKWHYLFEGKEKRDWDRFGFEKTELSRLPEPVKKFMAGAKKVYLSGSSDAFGCLVTGSFEPLSEKHQDIISRFAMVFNQTYTRFLDLQKAEAQAKEAQIEAALERVRSRSMAMHKSDELLEASEILFAEMQKLGIESLTAGYVLMDKEEKNGLNYTPDPSTKKILPLPIIIPHNETIHMQQVVENWKKGSSYYVVEMDEEETISHQTFIAERSTNFTLNAAQLIAISPARLFLHNFYFKEGYLLIVGGHKLSAEQTDIMLRFTKVFQQTYTRFLDLQKAEAQAREAQIELALERVRARTMAMQNSIELREIVAIIYEQLQNLGFTYGACGIVIMDEVSGDMNWWMAGFEKKDYPENYNIPYFDHPFYLQQLSNWKKGEKYVIMETSGEEKKKYDEYMFSQTDFVRIEPEARKIMTAFEKITFSNANMKHGALSWGPMPIDDDLGKILQRFAKVFEQTYTRFLDLQKAEAQAKEAQIETALERVRSKTMAMHNSTDVGETAAVMVEELKKLGVETIRCGLGIMHEPGNMEVWTISTDENNKTTIIVGWLDMNMHPLLHGAFESWRKKNESYSYELKGEDLLNYYNAINNYPGYPIRYDITSLPEHIHHNEFYFPEGVLFSFSLGQLDGEQRKIFKRVAGVFGQTYRRYLDLQKAEAQARQAKIEAAMEKVRSRAMAMQKPHELVEVAELLRKEMGLLGVEELETSSIYIHHEDTKKTECWYAIKDVQHPDKELVSDYMNIDLGETQVGKLMLAFYDSDQKQISIPMQGDARKEWINYCAAHSKVLVGFYGTDIPDRTYHLYKFSNGYMGAASLGEISAESWDLLQRATSVFSLAYTRFSDLQQAEAQAREAKIEAALERVRSRTLAMQKSDELAETAAEVFRQLIGLGIEPNRLYIGIVKEETGDMEMWATDEDGTKVGRKFMFNKNENASVLKLYDGWKAQKKSVIVDMQGKELDDYFHYLNHVMHIPFKGGLTQKRRVQSVAYFSKGFIGMASPDGQGDETIQLLERFAAVFNLTFTRFNDLKIAEAHALQAEKDLVAIKEAKQKAEEALTELQSTQKQLIQSEKMASLGELTAGIAHEIQNPLNFVNNFSEVSKELLDEMKEAIEKGDAEEAKEIMHDVIQNLEKINHHGKRADGIVKGMLQHSSSGSGKKEATDINALADEYLRLAYHGLRAKDKSFNATMKTEFDESIGNINIISQDIGRVILNLITNAFYVVSEKAKQNIGGYEPTVELSSRKEGSRVFISVKDNGNGIPQKILDKIFQPFFTTKPTGQGTGLGLSLSYDIVKAHGGELKAETKEGEGSEFIIQLPF